MAPFQQLALVVVVEAFQFVDVDILAQHVVDHEGFGGGVTPVEVHGTHQGLYGVAQHGAAEAGGIVLGEQEFEFHFVPNPVERFSLHQFGAHFGEEALIAIRVFFEKVFSNDGAQYGIAQVFQAFVVLHGIGFIPGVAGGFVRKRQLENTQIRRGVPQ